MRISFRDQAVDRIKVLFGDNQEIYTRPADLLADLIHYCGDSENFEFQHELDIAFDYVSDEILHDKEMDNA